MWFNINPMESCSINNKKILEWTAPHTEQLFTLLSKNTETSGELPIDTVNKKTTKNITVINGSEAAVEAPESMVNYHTHPATCYLNEKTVWGFPSGEDTRESLLFGLKGSIAHLVVAVEGTYVCQVNPCVIDNLINLDIDKNTVNPKILRMISRASHNGSKYSINDFYRGFIVLCVEIYFRSTHAFRTAEYAEYKVISPDDYVNFCNNFNFKNMFKKDNIKECTEIKCNKVWTFEKSLKQVSLEKYIDDYESDQNVYICSKGGSIKISNVNIVKFIKNGGLEPIKNYNFTYSNKHPDIKIDKWFLTKIFYHKVECVCEGNGNGSRHISGLYKKLSNEDKQIVLMKIAKNGVNGANGANGVIMTKEQDPVFYFFDVNGNCDHNSIKKSLHIKHIMPSNLSRDCSDSKDKRGHNTQGHNESFGLKLNKGLKKNLVFFGSNMCGHCVEFLKNATSPEFNKKFNLEVHKFDEIGQAIDSAKKYSDSEVVSIPAVFDSSNKKRVEHPLLISEQVMVYKT